jgi:hypothetical protein
MTHTTLPVRKRSTPEANLARLAEIAASQGITLTTTRWYGRLHDYQFRCARGHEIVRVGTVAMRGTVTCLECVQEDTKRRFLEILGVSGIVCREGGYLGQTSRQHFRCHCGHEWETEARKILEGCGCVVCATARRAQQLMHGDGLERLQRSAAAHGGRLLADAYVGIGENYAWECREGHRWRARGNRVIEGSWCAVCAARRHGEQQRDPAGLKRLKEVASSRGGECLSQSYLGRERKYQFRCARGHEWDAHGHLVLRGSWCMECANQAKRLTIDQMHDVARERGGRCLSETYVNSKTLLDWECHVGHVWSATPDNVIHRGAWCPNCFRLKITKKPHLRRRYDHEG